VNWSGEAYSKIVSAKVLRKWHNFTQSTCLYGMKQSETCHIPFRQPKVQTIMHSENISWRHEEGVSKS